MTDPFLPLSLGRSDSGSQGEPLLSLTNAYRESLRLRARAARLTEESRQLREERRVARALLAKRIVCPRDIAEALLEARQNSGLLRPFQDDLKKARHRLNKASAEFEAALQADLLCGRREKFAADSKECLLALEAFDTALNEYESAAICVNAAGESEDSG